MNDTQAHGQNFPQGREHFVGVDSDGCVFDTMELKHKECFVPCTIRAFGLQAVSRLARETWELVNLYSRSRGTNRFPGLVATLDLLGARPEAVRRGLVIPDLSSLRAWIAGAGKLDNATLKAAVTASGDQLLARTLEWSEAVNRSVADMVRGVPPFPFVRECLSRISTFADALCVSATPVAALTTEWEEHGIARHVRKICGQEAGSKKDVLRANAQGRYAPDRILMVGDAPGDLEAARAVGACFYPIVPGEEEPSWEELHREGLERFRTGQFRGSYEQRLHENFLSRLPEAPPWRS